MQSVPMRLSEQEVRFFRHVGFLRLKSIIPAYQVDQMRGIIEAHKSAAIEPLRRDTNEKVIRLDNLLGRDPLFMSVFTSEIILSPLQSLLGPNIELVLNRHNHASFNFAGDNDLRLHRDVLQWSRSVVTVFIYLDAATVENGCTQVVPASHFLPFIGTPNNGGTWMDEHSVFADLTAQCVPVPMQVGGVLLLDSLVFHAAGNNRTLESRRSVCCAYHSVDELSGVDDPKKILVCGEKLYRGNDARR